MTSIAGVSASHIPSSEKKSMPQNDHNHIIKIPRDSLIVHIPLHVTADLGIAMKRVRAKHIARFKQLHPHLFDNSITKTKPDATEASSLTVDGKDGNKSDAESDDDASQDKGRKGKDKDERNMQDESMMDTIGSEVRKEQFGSMVDYLEAKYARGVMIHDLDERIREKKKNDGGKGTIDTDVDLNVLSDSEAGSCYSEDSGDFIDDSDLRTDVAHQIFASSAFGTTRIEAEAASKAKGADDDSIGADDHAFFVNVGDLEMEDGWNDDIEEDQDWLNSMKKSKGKKRKRAPKDASSAKGASNDKKRIKKSKADDKDKKSADKKSTDKKSTDKKSTDKKGKEKQGDGVSPKKKSTKEKQGDGKSKTPSSTKEKKEKKKDDEHEKAKEAKSEQSPEIEEAKKDSHNLKRRVDRLFKKCVEVIESLTKEQLPRKMKGGTGKCQIIVPEGKAPGDLLQICNPHIPGQKLKVYVPKKKVPGDKFTIAVPLPEVRSSSKAENKITKECIDDLDKYSTMFDDWCQAEAKYKALMPKAKGVEKYKIGVERLKKYDKMVSAFPKNLEVPVDPAFLRLLVRRKRQNQSKRKSIGSESVGKPKVVLGSTMDLKIPSTGKTFPVVEYNMADFAASG